MAALCAAVATLWSIWSWRRRRLRSDTKVSNHKSYEGSVPRGSVDCQLDFYAQCVRKMGFRTACFFIFTLRRRLSQVDTPPSWESK
jgi:hypothetical protein